MVRVNKFIQVTILFAFVANYSALQAQKNSQSYIGRTLSDSAVQFSDNQWLNQRYIYGRYTASYGAPQKLKLGSMFTISGDSVTVSSSGGTGDVNQNGNSYGATMILGTNDNNQFRIKTNNVERFTFTTGTTTGGLLLRNLVTAKTNTVEDFDKIQITSTGTVANGFGLGLWATAPNAVGTIKDIFKIRGVWTSATNTLEQSKIEFHISDYGSLSPHFEMQNLNYGTLKISNTYPLYIDGQTFAPNISYEFLGNYQMKTTSTTTSNNSAINLNCTGQGSGTTINNATVSGTNPTSSNILSLDGSVTTTSTGTNTYTGLKISNTLSQGGGHTGTTRGIHITPTLTTPYDYRAIDISTTLGKGIYQSSTGVSNTLVGKTVVGSTASPIIMLQVLNGRFAVAKGNDVAIAANLTLGTDGNVFNITGTGAIGNIIATNFPTGSIIYLILKGAITLVHNGGTGGGGTPMLLSGSINYAAVNNSVLGLLYDGSVWQEISRKTP